VLLPCLNPGILPVLHSGWGCRFILCRTCGWHLHSQNTGLFLFLHWSYLL